MQYGVGVQIMAVHISVFVDLNHIKVLFHRQSMVEFDTGLICVVQGATDNGPGFDPSVVIRPAQQYVPQLGVIVVYTP